MKKKTKIILLILAVLYLIVSKKIGIGIPCLFYKITGFYCPGCGISRMFISLLQLDFYQAFRHNALVFILLIGYIIYKIINIKYQVKISNAFICFLLLTTISFGILRNIPLFDYLKPTEINSKR